MTPEEIIRALVEATTVAGDDNYHWCVLCQAGAPLVLKDHSPVCPWRLAVEYVAAIDNLAP